MSEHEKPSFTIPEGAVPDSKGSAILEDVPPVNEQGRADHNRIIDEHVEDRRAERTLRKRYAGLAFGFAVGGAIFWALVLIWSGWSVYYFTRPPFSDNVLIAITTATSINLFAAFLGVIRGLFPSNGSSKKT